MLKIHPQYGRSMSWTIEQISLKKWQFRTCLTRLRSRAFRLATFCGTGGGMAYPNVGL